jgi:hypothetical protein
VPRAPLSDVTTPPRRRRCRHACRARRWRC